jgi:hypothetical protein
MSGGGGGDVIQLPSLGRGGSLGMLYDVRSDQLISGITLWDNEQIANNLR